MRILFFLDRSDIMHVLVQKAAEGSAGSARIKALELFLKDTMREQKVEPSDMINKFSLHVELS